MVRSVIATIIFLLITIVLSILSIPAALLDRSGSAYLWLARKWSKCFLFLYGAKLRVTGLKNLKEGDHYVFVSNHASYTDIPVLFASIPRDLRLILRSSLTRIPIWGWALIPSPMIIINRTNASKAKSTLADAAKKIRDGASVLLFPEGTRSSTGKIQDFKRGAFHLAFESGAKVIPIAIVGTFAFMPRSAKLPVSNKLIEVRIGAPMELSNSISVPRESEIQLMRRAEVEVKYMFDL